MKKILTDLMEIMSPPGGESKVEGYLAEAVRKFAKDAEITSDAVGNLIVTYPGKGYGSVILCASVDESVFVANDADGDGRIRFASLGGLSPSAAAYSEVEFENGVRGTLVPLSADGERGEKADDPLSYAVDIGAMTREEASSSVPAGCAFRPVSRITENGDLITGASAGAKAGAAALLRAAKILSGRRPDRTVHIVFTSQGKVGARSVLAAARRLVTEKNPGEAGLCLCAIDSDPKDGIAILSASERQICDSPVARRALHAARDAEIKATLKAGGKASPDVTSAGKFIAAGVPAAVLGIPARYLGTPRATVALHTVDDAACVAVQFLFGENG